MVEASQNIPSLEQRIAASFAPDIPKIYFNGLVNAATNADIVCVLERNGIPVCVLNMSFTTAKTFAAGLGQAIANLEAQAGREIMTINDVERYNSGSAKQ